VVELFEAGEHTTTDIAELRRGAARRSTGRSSERRGRSSTRRRERFPTPTRPDSTSLVLVTSRRPASRHFRRSTRSLAPIIRAPSKLEVMPTG